MRRWASPWLPAIWVCALLIAAGRVGGTGQAPAAPVPGAVTPRAERFTLDQALLRWPLPAGEDRYGAIDGKRMHVWVVEQAPISDSDLVPRAVASWSDGVVDRVWDGRTQ